jgi:lipopolysaccharide/colanic/teichoic acid biosynthesis glycosyltransferase
VAKPVTGPSYDTWKRLIDISVASAGLVLTAPLQAILALVIRCNLGTPVLFRQKRPGKNERLFELVKFRTMRNPDPAMGLVTDADRLTRLGVLLRATSLDELPTLWNVLKGDMSLVGPRPLLIQYLDRYSGKQRRRHEVRPGVTGLAQVSGRNAITWEERFALDIKYVDTYSFALDVRILILTVGCTLRRKGITAVGDVTMPEFTRESGGAP